MNERQMPSVRLSHSRERTDQSGMDTTKIVEKDPCQFDEGEQPVIIRSFELSVGSSARVELSSLGASITRFLVDESDDIVLGYQSPGAAFRQRNPVYFGAVVGRVANRIASGRLQVDDKVYQLERNNPPNHLHGGSGGFSNCIWDACIVDSPNKAVQFTLISNDGDQNYPGTVKVKATYSLQPTSASGVQLSLVLEAELLTDQPTPVNLAQHSYWNLSRHDEPAGILNHTLLLRSSAYTPLNAVSIPTRDVCRLDETPCMDFRQGKILRDALADYGRIQADNDHGPYDKVPLAPNLAVCGPNSLTPGAPFGFDHNFIVDQPSNDDSLPLIGVLQHGRRKLTVRSDAPGVQIYSANYLDGHLKDCKGVYGQWQGLCLETQHFPDSVNVDENKHATFAQGRCVILRPNHRHYSQNIAYELELNAEPASDQPVFRGRDSAGNVYSSVEEMWKARGLLGASSATKQANWYKHAADYYEENCPATIDGVLGGFASISDLDLEGSRLLVKDIQRLQGDFNWSVGAACECGAGIGRVTKGLLADLGPTRFDLVESSSRLLYAAPDYLGDVLSSRCRFFCTGLQDWIPPVNNYSIIWIQWVLCYLTDEDVVAFLQRCGQGLVDGGVVVLKENTCEGEDFVLDLDDASVTRSVPYWKQLASRAGLEVVLERLQTNFPSDIFPVPMLAFRPSKS